MEFYVTGSRMRCLSISNMGKEPCTCSVQMQLQFFFFDLGVESMKKDGQL